MQTCQVSFTQSTVEGAAWGLLQSLRFTRIVKGSMPAVLCPVGDSQGLEVTGATLACIPMGLKWEHRSGWELRNFCFSSNLTSSFCVT